MDLPASMPASLLDELRRQRLLMPASQMASEVELMPSGDPGLDWACGGGFPRGGIVELVVPASGGGRILYAFLAAISARQELVALIDPADGFDVASAHAASVDLERLLWVRARSRKEALRAAEVILDAGGFAAVVLDMRCRRARPKKKRLIPSAAWMRLKRLASHSRAVLLVISDVAETGTFASLSVQARRGQARFGGEGERWLEGVDLSFEVSRKKFS